MDGCLLQTKFIMMKFWVEAIYCLNYLLNIVSIGAVAETTPVKKWGDRKPSFGHLQAFEGISLAHISDKCRKKLDVKSHAYIMMG